MFAVETETLRYRRTVRLARHLIRHRTTSRMVGKPIRDRTRRTEYIPSVRERASAEIQFFPHEDEG